MKAQLMLMNCMLRLCATISALLPSQLHLHYLRLIMEESMHFKNSIGLLQILRRANN